MIHHICPYHDKANIGKGLNLAIELIESPYDWICLRDGDTMYLRSDWGKRIEVSIDKFGQEYALMSCFTNRLNPNTMRHQLHNGICSKETDIAKHMAIYDTYPADPEIIQLPKDKVVAGFFMLFQKKTWLEVGGFMENSLNFDSDFTIRVHEKGLKVGVMTNLYMFHLYRLWNLGNCPQIDTRHLV